MITIDKNYIVKGIKPFDLDATLDCGQAFRWNKGDDGKWRGVVNSKSLCIWQRGDELVFENATEEEYISFWRDYFDLERDYAVIDAEISVNPTLAEITEFSSGIRILKQDSWEALCSFIISQNNNIPRIKGIIKRLCEAFGNKIEGGYSFPSAEALARLTVDDLAPIRSGFRAKYIIDAAQKVSSGMLDLSAVSVAPIDEAMSVMQTVRGVGPKVAQCALLYGCGRIECFPVDVWIARAMRVLFDGELPKVALPYAGIVQQYIFHYARMTKLDI